MNNISDNDHNEFEKELGAISLLDPTSNYSKRARALLSAEKQRSFSLRPFSTWLSTVGVVVATAIIGILVFWRPVESPNKLVENDSFDLPLDASQVAGQLDPSYEPGVHYTELDPPIPLDEMTEDEIRYFFSYPCNPCYEFEEILEDWYEAELNEYSLILTPAIWSDEMRHYAQVYYLAQEFGVLDQAHRQIFESLHDSGEHLDDLPSLIRFFGRFGISRQQVISDFNSEKILEQIQAAEQANQDYSVQSTPMLVVNGRFIVKPGREMGQREILKVVEYLIGDEEVSGL